MNRAIFGKNGKKVGVTPSVILINPKYSRNVSQVVRACSCFGVKQCWFTGDRVQAEMEGATRLPREERMKGYSEVDIIQYDYPFDQFKDCTPVGIEVLENAEVMTEFEHPENAVYVFGPEDGSLPKIAKSFCHRFVFIPMRHCANLAASAYLTLYDRYLKEVWNGKQKALNSSQMLNEHRGWMGFEDKYYGSLSENHKDVSLEEMLGDQGA